MNIDGNSPLFESHYIFIILIPLTILEYAMFISFIFLFKERDLKGKRLRSGFATFARKQCLSHTHLAVSTVPYRAQFSLSRRGFLFHR